MVTRDIKVAQEVKRLVSEALYRELGQDNFSHIFISFVKMTKDLRMAKVYFTGIEASQNPDQVIKKLNSVKGRLRKHLAENLHIKYNPDLVFYEDQQFEKQNEIESVLNDISGHDPMISLERCAEILDAAQTIIIATHEGPDPDGIASSLALKKLLDHRNKQVILYNPDPIPSNLDYLEDINLFQKELPDQLFDLAVLVDLGDPDRVGSVFAAFKSVKTWMSIDHHANSEHPLHNNYLDPQAASCSVLIHRLAKYWDIPIDVDMANYIYTSLSADTGSFKYSNVNPEALETAAEAVKHGADPWMISQNLWETLTLEKIKLLQRALTSLRLEEEGRVGLILLNQEDFSASAADETMTDGLINYPRAVPGVEVALCIREISEGFYKVSLRSKNYVDVARIAAEFEGGGHERAAGCKIKDSLDEVIARLLDEISQQLIRVF